MLKRIKIKGYKSFDDFEVGLNPLSVLFDPNVAGKSNFLDALQLLSKMAASRTLKDAFVPPVPGQAARILQLFRDRPQGTDRAGSTVVFHRGGSALVGVGCRDRQSVDPGDAPSRGWRTLWEATQRSRAGARMRPSLSDRDRDAAEIGRAASVRRISGRPERQGSANRKAQALYRAAGREGSPAPGRPSPSHILRSVSGPQHPFDAALPAALSAHCGSPAGARELAVLLLRVARAHAQLESRQ